MTPLVTVRQLSKSYGAVLALNEVSFEISPAEVVGLVGPNGAGKTTLLMLLAGDLRADSGEIKIGGEIVRPGMTPESAIFVPDVPAFYGFQTPRGYLRMVASLWQRDISEVELESVLSTTALLNEGNRKIAGFSRGMTQRLAWAHVLITRPKLILLDEPTSALDPSGIAALRSIVAGLKDAGSAVVFSSHSLSEVERVCDRVLFLNQGACTEVKGSPMDRASSLFMIQVHPASRGRLGNLARFATEIQQDGAFVTFKVTPSQSFQDVSALLREADIQVVSLSDRSQSLEAAFDKKLQGEA